MNNNIITFTANKAWLSEDSPSVPKPVIKSLPEWYRKADRFAKNRITGKPYIGSDGGKIPTWKACPAVFDIMGSGYSLNTPCDIEFFNDGKELNFKILNPQYNSFITKRPEMPQFKNPKGYHKDHFAWNGDWQIKLPNGYSALYSQPFNRFDLPFLTTNAIVDNDKVSLPGSMPFFIYEGFEGIIPEGTPYAQLIPFKRENWESEIIYQPNALEIMKQQASNAKIYRKPDGGIYKNEVWEPRKYE
jgi:hypothetical protein